MLDLAGEHRGLSLELRDFRGEPLDVSPVARDLLGVLRDLERLLPSRCVELTLSVVAEALLLVVENALAGVEFKQKRVPREAVLLEHRERRLETRAFVRNDRAELVEPLQQLGVAGPLHERLVELLDRFRIGLRHHRNRARRHVRKAQARGHGRRRTRLGRVLVALRRFVRIGEPADESSADPRPPLSLFFFLLAAHGDPLLVVG